MTGDSDMSLSATQPVSPRASARARSQRARPRHLSHNPVVHPLNTRTRYATGSPDCEAKKDRELSRLADSRRGKGAVHYGHSNSEGAGSDCSARALEDWKGPRF